MKAHRTAKLLTLPSCCNAVHAELV